MAGVIEAIAGELSERFDQHLGATGVVIDPLAHVIYLAPHHDPVVALLVVAADLFPVVLGQLVGNTVLARELGLRRI